jgi:Rrf2 family protein
MVHLALQPGNLGADLKAISAAQSVPPSYLAKIMRSLVRGGLVTSTLGRGGGYVLRKDPSEVTLLQIYELMEGEINFMNCMHNEKSCSLSSLCPQRPVWGRLQNAVEGVFKETTLQDLVPRPFAALDKETPDVAARP